MRARWVILVALVVLLVPVWACGPSQEELDEVTNQKQELESTNAQLSAEIAALQDNLENTERDLAVVTQSYEDEQAVVEGLRSELDALQREKTSLEGQFNNINSRVQVLSSEVAKVSGEIVSITEERDALQGELDTVDDTNAALRVSLESARADVEILTAERDGLVVRKSELEMEIENALLEVKSVEGQLHELRARIATLEGQLMEAVDLDDLLGYYMKSGNVIEAAGISAATDIDHVVIGRWDGNVWHYCGLQGTRNPYTGGPSWRRYTGDGLDITVRRDAFHFRVEGQACGVNVSDYSLIEIIGYWSDGEAWDREYWLE